MQTEVFRTTLTKLREQRGLTKTALAELVQVSDVYVGQLESGARNPSPALIMRIETALKVPPGSLAAIWLVEKFPDLAVQRAESRFRPLSRDRFIRGPVELFSSTEVAAVMKAKAEGGFSYEPSAKSRSETGRGRALRERRKRIDFPRRWGSPFGRIGITVDDDAMAPEVKSGDVVIVDVTKMPNAGDLVVVDVSGRLTVRRYSQSGVAIILDAHDRDILPMQLGAGGFEKVVGPLEIVMRNYGGKTP